MKKYILVLLLLLSNLLLFAQNKEFTIEDVVLKSSSELAPSKLEQLQWIPGTSIYSYINDNDELIEEYINGEKEKIISLNELNDKLISIVNVALKRFPKIEWIDKNQFRFWKGKSLFLYDKTSGKLNTLAELDKTAENMEVAPNDSYIAFTKDNNLYLFIRQTKIIPVTRNANSGIVSGQYVHRREFGIEKGIFWSPKSNYIAFYQKDETMVTDYPLVDLNYTPAQVENIKYPMAGAESEQVKIGIYSVNTESTIYLKTGEPKDQYLTSVTWGPEEKFIYVAQLNRDQNHLRLIKYNAKTGDPVRVLFEEENEKYVEPEHPLYFLPDDTNRFLWFSRRDGWKHLYLYTEEGDLINQVTSGNWEITSFEGYSEDAEYAFFVSTKESPIERQLYKVNLSTKEIFKLSEEEGYQKVKVSSTGNYFIDEFSSLKVPGITQIKNSDGSLVKVIHKSDNPIEDYKLGKIDIFTIENDNNDTLFCRMIYPTDFDRSKKYPVIVYVYSGPHEQLITNKWITGKYNFWFQKMAEEGFIVFTLDNRGSANRGLEFEQETFRHLGTVEIEDQIKGVEYLSSLDFVDDSRIGVYGWSYRGFMTTSLMLRTDKFKVGVAGGAVIDWKLYEVMYTERYMDKPETNPEGYKKANLLNYVDNLNGKLLLVHGTKDSTVVWQNTLLFAEKAANLNKSLDYYPYIGHGHGVKGRDAVHLYNKITDFFLKNL